METSRLEELMEKSIEASDRTTHAVRALVRFALIQITVTITAVILGGLGSVLLGGVDTGLIVGIAVLVIGGIYGLAAGWDELRKSDDTVQRASLQEAGSITHCDSCGAKLHMFSSKCPNCKKRVGF